MEKINLEEIGTLLEKTVKVRKMECRGLIMTLPRNVSPGDVIVEVGHPSAISLPPLPGKGMLSSSA